MNKFTYALALGAGLVLSLAAPNAQADPIVQSLTTANMSASQFNSLFTPTTSVSPLTQNYSFLNTGTAGSVVRRKSSREPARPQGVYAYAYQFTVNNATDTTTGEPTSVNSTSMLFNATPVVSSFTGSNAAAYVVTDGAIGSLSAPVAAPGWASRRPRRSPGNPVRRPGRSHSST